MPYATLWGFLAAVLRFVPYVGPAVSAILPSAISLAVFNGWVQPFLVIGFIDRGAGATPPRREPRTPVISQ